MKFGRRNFLKGLGSLAAAWMVKPKLPKLEDPPEEEKRIEEKVVDECPYEFEKACPCDEDCPMPKAEQTFYDDEKWPVSCDACHMYACFKDCPRHGTNPYRHYYTYKDTFRSLKEQQARRVRLRENVRRRAEENE